MWKYAGMVLLLFLGVQNMVGQTPFNVEIQEISMPNFPGTHSGAWAVHDGKWVFIGGRTNGLHGFLPPLAFPSSGIPDEIWVMDPQNGQFWSQGLDSLPQNIREAANSSNLQFYQEDSILYLVGGYGWNDTANAFRTFPTLTAVNLNQVVPAVMAATDIRPAFRQIADSRLAVCGAHLGKIGNQYQLVFGHRFDGMYDREDSTGFFVQDYTYQIRKFEIFDDGDSLALDNYSAETDSAHFRRRDYNLVPTIFPSGGAGYTAFSGVFQPDANLPWLEPIQVYGSGYLLQSSLQQQFNHYHSGVMPLYEGRSQTMHTVFFGGMAMFTKDFATGAILTDSLVPFVRTIAQITQQPGGYQSERVLPAKMPAYLGTNSYFIPAEGVATRNEGIIELDSLSGRTLVGYLVGGIESPDSNISDTDPSVSFASQRIFEVYVNLTITGRESQVPSNGLVVYPNPARDFLTIEWKQSEKAQISIFTLDGKAVRTWNSHGREQKIAVSNLPAGAYIVKVLWENGQEATAKFVKD